ncbi:hypothetical protein B0H13DRAFT_2479971 [Mycena leptocephala]|nr:hypothetical protein B0H13DRAFT_2479971 [Mycena leptocephala]
MAIIHWVFDNSSAHGSLAKNALTVTKMKVNPGGKVPEMRETVVPPDNPHGHAGKPQKMVFDNPVPNNHPHKNFEGQIKGMKVILAERGYKTNNLGKPLIGECKACKASKARKPHLEGASADEEGEIYGDDGTLLCQINTHYVAQVAEAPRTHESAGETAARPLPAPA